MKCELIIWNVSRVVIILISSFILLMIFFISYPLIYSKEVVTLYPEPGPTKIKPNQLASNYLDIVESSLYEKIAGRNNNSIRSSSSEPEKPLIINDDSTNYIEDIFAEVYDKNIIEDESNEISLDKISNTKNFGLNIMKIDAPNNSINVSNKSKSEHFYRIQLASIKDKDKAINLWNNFKAKYPEILNGLELVLKKINHGSDKFYFLILAGKYKNLSEAKNICMKLISKKQHCIIFKD